MKKYQKLAVGLTSIAAVVCVFAFVPNTYAETCPKGSKQAGVEINKKDGSGNAVNVTLNGNDGKPSSKKGVISSIAQCNLSADELDTSNNSNNLMKVVQTIINVVLGVLGIVTVAVIIIGGFNYITSSGDPAKVAKAKNTILYGVIGLIIALLAYAIVNFVLTGVFG